MFGKMANKLKRIRWKRVGQNLVSFVLVLSIVVSIPRSAFASEQNEYISELKMCTAADCSKEEAQKYLTDNGYKLVYDNRYSEPCNVGFRDAVYLGYKTTTDPKKAITDIAVMNMNGGYSFSEYEKLVKEQKEAMSKIITVVMYGVREYRNNYAAGSPAAKYAHDMMNTYREDDSGKLIGDFLLDSSISEDRLATVFMQASGIHFSVIKTNLALACTPYGKDAEGNDKISWMERLSKLGGEGIMEASGDDSNNVRAITLKKAFSLIVPDLTKYLQVQEIIDTTVGTGELTTEQEEMATTIINENYTPDTAILFSQSAVSYALLNSFAYEDWYFPEIKTIADLVMKSRELESFDFHAMASVMTEAEYQMISLIGVTPFINAVGNTEENWQKIRSDVASMNLEKPPITSIYQGVDRDLFRGKVAMTSESIRANNMNSDNNMLYGNIDEAAEIALFVLMGTALATTFGAAIYAGVSKIGFIAMEPIRDLAVGVSQGMASDVGGVAIKAMSLYDNISAAEQALWRDYYPERFTQSFTYLSKIMFAAMAVLAIVMVVFAALEIAYYFKNDYTTMPLIMMDSIMGKNADDIATTPILVKYDAVLQQQENIQNNYIADLNAFNGNQWIIMYTSKDKLAGAPILAKNFKLSYTAVYADNNVSPIHRFGEKDAYDLKTASGPHENIYGSFERDVNAFVTTASVFTFNLATALALAVGAIAGGIASAFGTLAIIKKKKKKTTEKPL